MDAPFLDLAYYLGAERVDHARVKLVAARTEGKGAIIGLPGRAEEVLVAAGSIILRTEGEDFCGGMRADVSQLRMLGGKVYASFVETAERLDCLYGAILVEYSLESPHELRADPRSLAFQNFYLSLHGLPSFLVQQTLSIVPTDAFVRKFERGVYVSMSPEYNPLGLGVERDVAQEVSVRIGSLIGEIVRVD